MIASVLTQRTCGGSTARLQLICLLFLALATNSAQSQTVSVVDFAHRTVSLDKPAARLIALAPHIVENIYSAGAGDNIVATVSYADYPEQAKAIPRIGSFQSWSLESIIELQPDLVLLWASGNGMRKVSALERLNIPVYVSEPKALADIAKTLRDIGVLTNRSATAEAAAEKLEDELAALEQRYRDKEKLDVFYQVWNKPLQTLNGQHWVSDVMTICGARNIFSKAPTLAPKITVEAVLASNPQAIVASGMDIARPEWLNEWLAYPQLQAVNNQALYFIPPDYLQRPTTRILKGANSLCQQLDQLRSSK